MVGGVLLMPLDGNAGVGAVVPCAGPNRPEPGAAGFGLDADVAADKMLKDNPYCGKSKTIPGTANRTGRSSGNIGLLAGSHSSAYSEMGEVR